MAVRRRRTNPLVGWGLVALAVILLLLVIRAIAGGDDYSPRALAAAERTEQLGKAVTGLRTELESIDRLTLFRQLTAWEREAQEHLELVADLDPPKSMRVANGYLVASLGIRAEAMTKFNPSVRNALSDRDLQVAASQLLSVMRDLQVADRSYQLFVAAWPAEAARKPSESKWVADDDDATLTGVTSLVRELRNQEALEENFNLTIASITVEPRPAAEEGGQDQLPFTRSLSVSVVVTNTGNQPVPSVPVAAILTSEANPEPQTAEGTVPGMRPGERRSVTLTGIEPTAGGAVNLLRVTVGPVAGERNLLDNTQEYKFVMRRP